MKKFLLGLITWYKTSLSPGLPPACRFIPTCSEYTYGAIERFGAWRGLLMGIWRILRCNPFSKGGVDPVPEHWRDAFRRKKTQ